METPTATIRFRVNTNTEVVTLTAAVIRLISPVLIEQGCKIQNNLSLGSYSSTNPNRWIKTTSIQSGSLTTRNNITAGVNIYATDGVIKAKNIEITTTAFFTGLARKASAVSFILTRTMAEISSAWNSLNSPLNLIQILGFPSAPALTVNGHNLISF